MKYVIGLMSGTSLDGVDIAIVKTDGEAVFEPVGFRTFEFEEDYRKQVRAVFGQREKPQAIEDLVTQRHIQAVERFLQSEQIAREDVALIGFHGQTIFHDPEAGLTVQLGDGETMARQTGIAVVNDLRSADVAAGGQGAPLVPVFHRMLCKDLSKPVCVLNLGGVGNVTYIGPDDNMLAFDTGPGNALLDDWMARHRKESFDKDGNFSKSGEIVDEAVNAFVTHPYFQMPAPKSLDRDAFHSYALNLVDDLSAKDGAATLCAFTVASVMKAQELFPDYVGGWIVCGGGRLNKAMMSAFKAYLEGVVMTAEDVGWDGDAIEAQAFAYLAARAEKGLALTFPTTTGVPEALSGGRLHRP